MNIKRRLGAIFTALALALGLGLIAAPAASAYTYGYVYVSMPTWLGNCAWGDAGRIVSVSGEISGVSSVSNDIGDDLVYMRVKLGVSNTANFTGFCSRYRIPQPGFTQTVVPTRNNQTIWVGPGGWRRN